MNEADTCRKLLLPRLQAAGWDDEPHSIAEQWLVVAELDAMRAQVDTLEHLQASTAAELDALLPSSTRRSKANGDCGATAATAWLTPGFLT
ncbi:MAG TPA: hypothetical protein PLS53_08355, partial [Thermoanaerobaculaceae bacterium]|nr:hypothetical protein [Thermoanaerobaculaceae bacterium]